MLNFITDGQDVGTAGERSRQGRKKDAKKLHGGSASSNHRLLIFDGGKIVLKCRFVEDVADDRAWSGAVVNVMWQQSHGCPMKSVFKGIHRIVNSLVGGSALGFDATVDHEGKRGRF